MKWDLDTPTGHLSCVLAVFAVGVALYACGRDYGKEIIAGALGSLWTLLQTRRGPVNVKPEVVNQAETITISSDT